MAILSLCPANRSEPKRCRILKICVISVGRGTLRPRLKPHGSHASGFGLPTIAIALPSQLFGEPARGVLGTMFTRVQSRGLLRAAQTCCLLSEQNRTVIGLRIIRLTVVRGAAPNALWSFKRFVSGGRLIEEKDGAKERAQSTRLGHSRLLWSSEHALAEGPKIIPTQRDSSPESTSAS